MLAILSDDNTAKEARHKADSGNLPGDLPGMPVSSGREIGIN
jgi:hypothetical protein